MKKITVLFISMLALSACDVNVGNDGVEGQSNDQKLTYSYSVNGCETGEHTFSSLTDMCRALANDDLNNYCATKFRCERFKQDCQGLDLGVTCD